MTRRQKNFFKYAKNMSEMSSFPRVHIGCVATYGNKVIATGFNSTKSNPIQKKYNQYRDFTEDPKASWLEHSLHAEIATLKQLEHSDIDFGKCELWVYREKRDGSLGMCRPCSACLKYISDLGIKVVHYTTDEAYVMEEFVW